MISSVNAFSGLSASQVLKLFATSATPQSGAAPASPSTPTGGGADDAKDPASTIKAILAQAQIGASASTTLGGSAFALPFYDETTSQFLVPAAPPASQTVQTVAAYASASQNGSTVAASAQSGVTTGLLNDNAYATILSFSSVAASTDGGDDSIDKFEATVAIGDDSLTIGFSVSGLGLLSIKNNEIVAGSGQGALQDFFQIGVAAHGQSVALSFNVAGLDNTQAKALGAAFEQALATSADPTQSNGNLHQFEQSYAPGFSSTIVDINGY